MERTLPTPTMRFFRRKSCVLMPFFVEELVRTIRQIAPGQCGDRINHLPKSGLRPLDLVKRISERFLRPLAFNGDASDVTCAFYEREVFFGGNSRLMGIKRESAQHLVVLRQDRLGPPGSYPISGREIAILLLPALLRGDIGDNHPVLAKCCSPAYTCFVSDLHSPECPYPILFETVA